SGIQKLRTRINLQYDTVLPFNTFDSAWQMRVAGYTFYDWAYLIHNRHDYSDAVLDDNEWEAEIQEFWVQGKLAENIDIRLGRQIVNWGRSDSLRVLDILNPLDSREPGLADIEDLRLPVTLIKTDIYLDEWDLSLIALPETRFSKYPSFGSDFSTVANPYAPLSTFREKQPQDIRDTSWAAGLTGIFSGWDISFHAARYWRDQPYLKPNFNPLLPLPTFNSSTLEHSRVTLIGTGGNYTLGSWLFKSELAYLDGVDHTTTTLFNLGLFIPGAGIVPFPNDTTEKQQFDALLGIEYYGFADTTLSLEVANRHIVDYKNSLQTSGVFRDNLETALRYTRSLVNDRLNVTALGLMFGDHGQHGGLVRLSTEYDIRDALVLSGGVIYYDEGDTSPFTYIDKNDRVFAEVKYSF
ncbi:MAG: hypothetical protein KDI30_10465, partial [Pseudomonadales bacterium]|nr:hypothetical protein [Pseudomonadales bacterium]